MTTYRLRPDVDVFHYTGLADLPGLIEFMPDTDFAYRYGEVTCTEDEYHSGCDDIDGDVRLVRDLRTIYKGTYIARTQGARGYTYEYSLTDPSDGLEVIKNNGDRATLDALAAFGIEARMDGYGRVFVGSHTFPNGASIAIVDGSVEQFGDFFSRLFEPASTKTETRYRLVDDAKVSYSSIADATVVTRNEKGLLDVFSGALDLDGTVAVVKVDAGNLDAAEMALRGLDVEVGGTRERLYLNDGFTPLEGGETVIVDRDGIAAVVEPTFVENFLTGE